MPHPPPITHLHAFTSFKHLHLRFFFLLQNNVDGGFILLQRCLQNCCSFHFTETAAATNHANVISGRCVARIDATKKSQRVKKLFFLFVFCVFVYSPWIIGNRRGRREKADPTGFPLFFVFAPRQI